MAETELQKTIGDDVKPLRTYEGDIEDVIKGERTSLTQMAMAENNRQIKRRSIAEPYTPVKSNRMIRIAIGGGALILLGVGSIFLFSFLGKPATPTGTPPSHATLLGVDVEKELSLDGLNRDSLIQTLTAERDRNQISLSSIVGIYFTVGSGSATMPATVVDFFSLLGAHVPSVLERALDSDFMFGLHSFNGNRPFLVLKTKYYQNAFAGMLQWENSVENDLGPIFLGSLQTSRATSTATLVETHDAFEDLVVKNHDARVLRDGNGNIIFIYSFPDKNTILITTNADTLSQVEMRLIETRLIQ